MPEGGRSRAGLAEEASGRSGHAPGERKRPRWVLAPPLRQPGAEARLARGRPCGGRLMATTVRPGSVLDDGDWAGTEEGRAYMGALLRRSQRRTFGLIERPVLAPSAAADVAAYKVFVSGKSGVGKTALVAKLAGLEPPPMHHETTGIQTSLVYWPAKLRESNRVLFFRFSFWDCGEALLRKFDHILPACREKADAVLFLFSFTDRASFLDLPQQISRVTDGTKDVVRMVVGTNLSSIEGILQRNRNSPSKHARLKHLAIVARPKTGKHP
ncbi:ciliogenesis and planar polarity effector 2 isoform 2-T2 [Vipera latastei]